MAAMGRMAPYGQKRTSNAKVTETREVDSA